MSSHRADSFNDNTNAKLEPNLNSEHKNEQPARRKRSRWIILFSVIVILALAGAVAFYLWQNNQSESTMTPPAPNSLPPTVKIVKRDLADQVVKTADLGYGPSFVLTNKISGTVTELPNVDTVIERGQVLYKLDEQPVVLMYGKLPMYRSISVSTEGPDADQFAANLNELGFNFTTYSIKQWQKSLGLEQSGIVDLGRVFYSPDAIRIGLVKASIGDTASPTTVMFEYTGRTRLATVKLRSTDQVTPKVGDKLNLNLPNGSTVAGTVATIGVTTEKIQDKTETYRVISISTEEPNMPDTGTAKVTFVKSVHTGVLVVPIEALLALSEGGYGVEVIDLNTGKHTIIAVKTGLFSEGNVEISGTGIKEGLAVGVPA